MLPPPSTLYHTHTEQQLFSFGPEHFGADFGTYFGQHRIKSFPTHLAMKVGPTWYTSSCAISGSVHYCAAGLVFPPVVFALEAQKQGSILDHMASGLEISDMVLSVL